MCCQEGGKYGLQLLVSVREIIIIILIKTLTTIFYNSVHIACSCLFSPCYLFWIFYQIIQYNFGSITYKMLEQLLEMTKKKRSEVYLPWIGTAKNCKVPQQALAGSRGVSSGPRVDSCDIGHILDISPGVCCRAVEASIIQVFSYQLTCCLVAKLIHLSPDKGKNGYCNRHC